ncbi:Sulfite exporter TauE/SafE [Corynebacterium ciconiae DSM 44920]|uniref:sulfite exporter TauE/SafE family protein n=1 Tax=Corynebacterium ciconiae TaxID=227319 RepID=UPI000362F192|nr:sulfite exporter TauE/SafE family protein [Corynebacterium ciconiae]WKD61073.1 Sulfite exporter TauE/SafE [Corynebacterium ciconiae DSM 44920]
MLSAFIIFFIVVLGSLLQRVSGMGLGLIAAPVLTVLLGPIEGILVLNVLAVVNAAITTATVRQWVDWRMFSIIGSVLVLGSIPAALLIRAVSAAWLMILVGALLLLALGIVTYGKRWVPPVSGALPAAISGIVGGFMNTIAGVAGPAITVYAKASGWEQRSYAATLQPIFIVSGLVSLTMKLVLGAGSLASTPVQIWPVGLVAMLIGIYLGVRCAPRIPRDKAHRLALFLATAGGVSALIRGVLSL